MTKRYVVFETAFGWCAVGGGERVSRFLLPLRSARQAENEVRRFMPEARRAKTAFAPIRRAMRHYFNGVRVEFDSELDLSSSTEFQQAAWRAAQRIPYGQVRTYQQLASEIGRPAAIRAVGQAMARNPLPLLVPCHRVVRSDGTLGGFSAASGLRLKEAMLRLEGISITRGGIIPCCTPP